MGSSNSAIRLNAEGLPCDRNVEEQNWLKEAIDQRGLIHDVRRLATDTELDTVDLSVPNSSITFLKCSPVFRDTSTCIVFGTTMEGDDKEINYPCFGKNSREIGREIATRAEKYKNTFTIVYDNKDVNQFHIVRLAQGERVSLVWADLACNIPEYGNVVKNTPVLLRYMDKSESVDILLCNGVHAQWIKRNNVYIALPSA